MIVIVMEIYTLHDVVIIVQANYLTQTLNKAESCISRTLNKVPI